jgi:hypothetical protein
MAYYALAGVIVLAGAVLIYARSRRLRFDDTVSTEWLARARARH